MTRSKRHGQLPRMEWPDEYFEDVTIPDTDDRVWRGLAARKRPKPSLSDIEEGWYSRVVYPMYTLMGRSRAKIRRAG